MSTANNDTETRRTGGARTSGEPPKILFKIINPVMKLLLRSPLGTRLGKHLLLLTFKGRKSGRLFTTPVGYHRRDGEILLFTSSPWWRNFRGGAPVTLLLERRKVAGRAEVVEDREKVFEAISYFLSKIGYRNARRLGISIDTSHEPTEQELRQAAADTVMIRLELADSGSQP